MRSCRTSPSSAATHVAMEATGSYWKPVFNLLEGQFTVWVVNAAHIKAMPGHKTDVHDAEWIADLLQHGLLKPSFIPDRFQRELRDLTRSRTELVNPGETGRRGNYWAGETSTGLLIHAGPGNGGGTGA